MDEKSGLISIRILAIARDETEAHELRVLQDRFQAAQPQPGCSMGGVEDACGRAAKSRTAVQARASAYVGGSMEQAGGDIGVLLLAYACDGAALAAGVVFQVPSQADAPSCRQNFWNME